MMRRCRNCKHSKQNNATHMWCHQIDECGSNHDLFEPCDNPYRVGVPISTDDCECRWPNIDDVPEGMCAKCGLNKLGGACGYEPKIKLEPVIITASRFYTLPPEEGMHDTEPIVFDVEG